MFISYKKIIPIKKETQVPYKICSYDIEADSSHGDFPLPIKSYEKLTSNIIDIHENSSMYTEVIILDKPKIARNE